MLGQRASSAAQQVPEGASVTKLQHNADGSPIGVMMHEMVERSNDAPVTLLVGDGRQDGQFLEDLAGISNWHLCQGGGEGPSLTLFRQTSAKIDAEDNNRPIVQCGPGPRFVSPWLAALSSHSTHALVRPASIPALSTADPISETLSPKGVGLLDS